MWKSSVFIYRSVPPLGFVAHHLFSYSQTVFRGFPNTKLFKELLNPLKLYFIGLGSVRSFSNDSMSCFGS